MEFGEFGFEGDDVLGAELEELDFGFLRVGHSFGLEREVLVGCVCSGGRRSRSDFTRVLVDYLIRGSCFEVSHGWPTSPDNF